MWPSAQDGRRRCEGKTDRFLLSLCSFFPHFGSKRSKRRLDILEENRRLIHCFSFISSIPTFLLKTHFRLCRICMGRNHDNSCVILTIQTVPLSFLKSGTTQHHQPPTTWVDFLWIFMDYFPREFPTINHIYPYEKSALFCKLSVKFPMPIRPRRSIFSG